MKDILGRYAKNYLPRILYDILGKWGYNRKISRFYGMAMVDVFTEIYSKKLWRNDESVSGPGSTVEYAQSILIPSLSAFFSKFNIETMLDAPCGDFNWMKEVDLSLVQYTGIDIVPELIYQLQIKYASVKRRFIVGDISNSNLPKVDLIISRDYMVHLSNDLIFQSMYNFKKSQSKYLLCTSFTNIQLNYDIITGDWRPINLQKPPFNFPAPKDQLGDFSKEMQVYNSLGKILGLWDLTDLII